MKARIKFTKTGVMKFIGHLDMMRYFQKAFRRAGFDVEYSKGYNPHQILSFASPLGVGVTSEGEYLDLGLNSSLSIDEMIRNINSVMAEGISVTGFRVLQEDCKNSMSIVACADYKVTVKEGALKGVFQDFISLNEILVIKKSKKGEKEIDIKPMIIDIYFNSDNEIFMRLMAGSENNLKPQLVIEAMYKFAGFEYNPFDSQIHRIDVYANIGTVNEPDYVSLLEV